MICLCYTLKPIICNQDRGALFEKTEPSLNSENPETKASEMLFCFATSTSKQLFDVFATFSCETPQYNPLTYVEI